MNNQSENITFKLNKLKIFLTTLGSMIFVLAGFGMLYSSGLEFNFNTLFIQTIGLVAIIFFGMTGVFGFIKLFDKNPGLIINHEGIYDNSSAIGGQLIKWKDITDYDLSLINQNSFLHIFVNNPQEYISKANWFKRFWMRLNKRFYGTPLNVSPNFIKGDLVDLAKAIRNESNKYNAQQRV
ncbi:STM3941 family protein [Psychroserpens mesophilus]|uniref:STM3941 family protein n=1 Tax=Psychroserpens mesophilus TaxID=325473 RepID=UPI000693CCE4|nr:STM3941 family protein [Psychroserpens mesophilus]